MLSLPLEGENHLRLKDYTVDFHPRWLHLSKLRAWKMEIWVRKLCSAICFARENNANMLHTVKLNLFWILSIQICCMYPAGTAAVLWEIYSKCFPVIEALLREQDRHFLLLKMFSGKCSERTVISPTALGTQTGNPLITSMFPPGKNKRIMCWRNTWGWILWSAGSWRKWGQSFVRKQRSQSERRSQSIMFPSYPETFGPTGSVIVT